VKRGIAVCGVVAAGIVISFLAACGTTTNGAQAPATQPTTSTTTTTQRTTTVVVPPTTASVPAKIYAAFCTVTKTPAPTELSLSCVGSNKLRQATWSTWNYDHADGTGALTLNNCQPDCLTGTGVDYPVSVRLDTPGQTTCGAVWTRAVFTYLGAPPKGADVTYHNGKATFTLTTNPATVVGC
jgi:hypothetical protein